MCFVSEKDQNIPELFTELALCSTVQISITLTNHHGPEEEEAHEAMVLVRLSVYRSYVCCVFNVILDFVGTVIESLTRRRSLSSIRRPSISNASFVTRSCTLVRAW